MGEQVLDLSAAAARLLPARAGLFTTGSLEPLMAAGPAVWHEVRGALRLWLDDAAAAGVLAPLLRPVAEVQLHLPYAVADYVDFYSSLHHATRVGEIFRPGVEPLSANWKHLPIGYHGRAGTVVASGTPVVRPTGQRRTPEGDVVLGPSRALDVEVEVGFVVGVPSGQGASVPLSAFADHVFGVCLVNDWSARDVQAFESAPLGPFLGKSFATTASAWLVPLAALEAARVPPPERDVPLLPYLDDAHEPPWGLDVRTELRVNGALVSAPPLRTHWWTGAQQLAHLTVNGASLRTGDLYASGTVSGPGDDERGCLLELTWGGRRPVELADGTRRTYLEDGDEVLMTATAPGPGGTTVGLGEVRGRVLPAR